MNTAFYNAVNANLAWLIGN